MRLVNTVTNDVRFNSQKRHRAKEEEREGEMGEKKGFKKFRHLGARGGGKLMWINFEFISKIPSFRFNRTQYIWGLNKTRNSLLMSPRESLRLLQRVKVKISKKKKKTRIKMSRIIRNGNCRTNDLRRC